MTPHTESKCGLRFVGVFFLIFAFLLSLQGQNTKSQTTRGPAGQQVGKQTFVSNCVGCHGLDGTGTDRAPNIVTNSQAQKLSAAEMFKIVLRGVPGTGMPAFSQLGTPTIKSVVAYVRSLQGKHPSAPLPGDPKTGEALFFGDTRCSSCHMVSGKGGFIGPELTAYAQTHTAEEIEAAITTPDQRASIRRNATIVTTTGERYEGVVRNEDNFSLQLQSPDGAFHFFSKTDVKSLERGQRSIMPSDYATRLSRTQLNDLVSYLLSIAGNSPGSNTKKVDGFEE